MPSRRSLPRVHRPLPPLPHGLEIVLLPDGYRWTCFLCDSHGKKSVRLPGLARQGAKSHKCCPLGRAAASLKSFLRTDQEWVTFWNQNPDQFLRIVKAFERSVLHYPDHEAALKIINLSHRHRVPHQRGPT